MTDVAALNVSATETGVAKVDKALLGLAGSALKAETATGRFTSAQMKAAQSAMSGWDGFNATAAKQPALIKAASGEMKNYGMHTANVFSQLNDIGVMMASGQNPLTLALQQGTQLNQVWGQMGGKVGAIGSILKGAFMSLLNPINLVTIGVIAGGAALVNYFSGGSEGAKTFKESLDELETSISNLNDITSLYSIDGLEKLREKYGELNSEIIELINNQRILAIADAAAKLQETLAKIGGGLGDGMFNTSYGELSRVFETSANNAQILYGVIENIGNLDSVEKQLFAITNLKDELSIATNGFTVMTGEQRAMFSALVDAESQIRALTKSTQDAERAAVNLNNAAPGSGWMGSAIKETNLLIGRLMVANGVASKLAGSSASFRDPREGLKDVLNVGGKGRGLPSTNSTDGYTLPTDWASVGGGGSGGGSSGGGGGAKDPYQSNLDRLVTSLMTERETVEKWHADNEVLLNDKRAKEILGVTAHKEAMLDLERQYQEKISKIKDDSDRYNLQSTSQFFGDLNSLAGGGYDGLMRAQKSFAAASALVNTYLAASQALADPRISTFAKFIAVAKVVAAGMGLVNAIKGGSKSSGGGSSGGSSSAPTTAGTAAVEPTRTTTVNFQGDPFMVAIAESVMSQMYDATGNGRVLIKA